MINSVIKNIFFHSISIFFKNLTKNNFSFPNSLELILDFSSLQENNINKAKQNKIFFLSYNTSF